MNGQQYMGKVGKIKGTSTSKNVERLTTGKKKVQQDLVLEVK